MTGRPVEIVSERETPGGWSFELRLAGDDEAAGRRTLRLSWADYDLWSADGADPPHAVAEAVVRFVLSRMTPADLGATIDASIARRRLPDADEEIPRLIGKKESGP